MQEDRYLEAYEKLVALAIEEADKHYDTLGIPNDRRDYGEWICEAEAYATTDEVVGYYLLTYPNDFKPAWDENIIGITLTDQDKEVDSILGKLWCEKKRLVK